MDLTGKTILVAMSELEWLVRTELEQAGARVIEASDLAGAQQILDGSETRIDALVLGVGFGDGYAGSLIQQARSGHHRCETVVCVTDPASEALLVRRVLEEDPASLVELPREVRRLVSAVHAAVKCRSTARRQRRGSKRPEAEQAPPVDLLQAIFGTGDSLLRCAMETIRSCGLFTPAEAEILCMFTEGYEVDAIAAHRNNTVGTIHAHMTNIRKKIAVRTPGCLLRLLAAEIDRQRIDQAENE